MRMALCMVFLVVFAGSCASPAQAKSHRDGTTQFHCQVIYFDDLGYIFYYGKLTCRGARTLALRAYRVERAPSGFRCNLYFDPLEASCVARNKSSRRFGFYREAA